MGYLGQRTGEYRQCKECAGTFYVHKSRKVGKYCGVKCMSEAYSKKPAWNKGKSSHWMLGKKNHKYKHGKSQIHGWYRARKMGAPGSHTQKEWADLKVHYKGMCLCCKRPYHTHLQRRK